MSYISPSGQLIGLNSIDLVYQAETEILNEISALIGRGSLASADWKIEKLRKLGTLNAKAMEIVRKYRDAVLSGVESQVEKAALDALIKTEQRAILARAKGGKVIDLLPPAMDPAIRSIIDVWKKSAVSDIKITMASLANNAGQVYTDVINRAAFGLLSGADSGQAAIAKACREWAEKGITLVDKAGRNWSTESYADMVLRTNVRRVTTETTFKRMDQYQTDLIEISSHAGARELCAPYQGTILSRSGADKDYTALSDTSYGEPAGLFGINCGHIAYPFWKGISTQTFSPMGDADENARIYALSQKQRGYERAIRAAKREVANFEAMGDLGKEGKARAKSLLRDRQAAMDDFIEKTNRTRRRDRERIFDLGGIKKNPMGLSGNLGPIKKPGPIEAKSIKEAEAWARDNLGTRYANFGNADINLVNELNKGALEYVTKFPAVKTFFQDFGTTQALQQIFVTRFVGANMDNLIFKGLYENPEERRKALTKAGRRLAGRTPSNVYAYSVKDGDYLSGVGFNTRYLEDAELFKMNLTKNVVTGWHPIGCDTVKSVLDHEFAHQLDGVLKNLSQSREFRDLLKQYDVKKELSAYAAEDTREAFAEGWAEYKNNPNPRPLAKKIGKLIEQKYNELFGGAA